MDRGVNKITDIGGILRAENDRTEKNRMCCRLAAWNIISYTVTLSNTTNVASQKVDKKSKI